MATKKLDKEHLESINALQQQFTQNTNAIGSLTIELEFLETQKQSLESRKTALVQQFFDLRTEETKLIETLKERYGDGQINIIDGTFTPNDDMELYADEMNDESITAIESVQE
jgi:hypothetical protein